MLSLHAAWFLLLFEFGDFGLACGKRGWEKGIFVRAMIRRIDSWATGVHIHGDLRSYMGVSYSEWMHRLFYYV